MPNTENSFASERITAVYLDGNSLMAAVVSLNDHGGPYIHDLRLIETEDLVERVDRVPHPIYMNTEHLVFPNQEILSQALDVLLDGESFRNPVVGVLPPDLVDLWTDDSAFLPREQHKRVRAGIKANLDGNPYGYPKLLSFDLVPESHPTKTERSRVRLWTCRFDDVLCIADQLLRLDIPFMGIITGQRAFTEIAQQLAPARPGASRILIDLGKLRTTYLGVSATNRTFTHVIPVGLARDDNRYFASFIPTLAGLRALSEVTGGLLIPPDYTPTGHYDNYPATPQIEVTRFATNVAEYATRLLQSERAGNGSTEPPSIAISGLPASLPDLPEYLEGRTANIIQPFDHAALDTWQSDDPQLLAKARNHLPAIGGALAFLRRSVSRYGILQRDHRPKRFSVSGARMPEIEPEAVYILEWGSRE